MAALENENGTTTVDVEEDFGNEVDPPISLDTLTKIAADDGKEGDSSDDDEKSSPGSKDVPHGRFNEVNEAKKRAEAEARQEREARIRVEERLKALEESRKEPVKKEADFDFDAKEDAYAEAISIGDREAARAIRTQIRAAESAQRRIEIDEARDEAEKRALSKFEQSNSNKMLADVAEKALSDYPFLDVNSSSHNEEATDEVVALRDLYIGKGQAPHLALRKAIDKVAPRYADKVEDAEIDDKKAAENRARDALRKAADANNRIPPRGTGTGERSRDSVKSVEKMSDKEFAALSDEEFAKMAGNNV